jgi:hypothetical protein
MSRAAVLSLIVLIAQASVARAGGEAARKDALHLRTVELLALLGSPEPPPPLADPLTSFIDHLGRTEIGLRPLFALLPATREVGDSTAPTFALIARAYGRAVVSLTRPGVQSDTGQRLVLQRTLVSDLLEGRRFALTVYEDHALSASATRFVGVGARMTLRPTLRVYGWRLRLELLGSYDLTGGPAAYLALSGGLAAPSVVVPVSVP